MKTAKNSHFIKIRGAEQFDKRHNTKFSNTIYLFNYYSFGGQRQNVEIKRSKPSRHKHDHDSTGYYPWKITSRA